MMENGAEFPYYSDPVLGCQVVGLPYKDNIATMYFVLPNEPGYQALKHLLYRLTVNHLQGLADSAKETTVLIRVPRMKLESTIYLKEALEVLGVQALFDPYQADLSQISEHRNADYFTTTDCLRNKNETQEQSKSSDNITLATYPCTEYRMLHTNTSTDEMLKKSIHQADSVRKRATKNVELSASEGDSNVSNSGRLYADNVIHKVTIDVTEVGTEAAATSVVSLTRDGFFKLVKFERPFLFFIRHEATGCILFWGTVVKPTPNYVVPSVK
jgi:serine protease inhibitor